MPCFLLSQYSFWNGGSVPSCWVTLYWMGVSVFLSSSSAGFLKSFIDKSFIAAVFLAGVVGLGLLFWEAAMSRTAAQAAIRIPVANERGDKGLLLRVW